MENFDTFQKYLKYLSSLSLPIWFVWRGHCCHRSGTVSCLPIPSRSPTLGASMSFLQFLRTALSRLSERQRQGIKLLTLHRSPKEFASMGWCALWSHWSRLPYQYPLYVPVPRVRQAFLVFINACSELGCSCYFVYCLTHIPLKTL